MLETSNSEALCARTHKQTGTMKIEITRNCIIRGTHAPIGQRLNISDAEGYELIGMGKAIKVEEVVEKLKDKIDRSVGLEKSATPEPTKRSKKKRGRY